MSEPINLLEFERNARAVLPEMVFDYYAGGAEDEETLRANADVWSQHRLIPRALVDVRAIDTGTRLLGRDLSFPLLTAPCAFNRLAHEQGEMAVARAASKAGVIQVLSTASTTPMEEVAAEVPGAGRWFQLYCYKDRELTLSLVRRAEAAGFDALCLTVDVAMAGRRERDIRNSFHLPPGIGWANLDHLMGPDQVGSALTAYIHERWERNLTWELVGWLQSETSLPLVVKGIMHPEDAVLAVEAGVAGLVVSNHGGRQLDGSASTGEMLPRVAAAVAGRLPLLVDGGIRRGTHLLKALALGADAVLVGRPYLWGLAAGGEEGVTAVLEHLRSGLEVAMALCGCRSIPEIKAKQILV